MLERLVDAAERRWLGDAFGAEPVGVAKDLVVGADDEDALHAVGGMESVQDVREHDERERTALVLR